MIAATAVGRRRPAETAQRFLIAAAACGASIAVAATLSVPSLLVGLGAVTLAGVALWMFLSERLEWPLAVLGLYLGLLDGFLKLSISSSFVTLGRDFLLYGIVLGFLARAALKGQTLARPPLVGWVLAYTAIVLVQLFNPGNAGIGHSLSALRPHLEFVPLFFFGYAVMRTTQNLRRFFVILLVCASANGIVSVVQSGLTPEQLSSWGPGYSARINGTGDVSSRTFADSSGLDRVRPFGLGSDSGAGAVLGLVSLGAALAFLVLIARSGINKFALLLAIGPPLSIIAGQSRTSVVAGIVVVLVFVLLSTSARFLVPTVAAVLLGIALTWGAVSVVSSDGSGVFDRYKTITPSELAATTQQSRGKSLARIPGMITTHPLGAGIGFVGPAGGLLSDKQTKSTDVVNGETGPTFLLSELGIPGLVTLLGFTFVLLLSAARWVRRMQGEQRVLLAGVAAGIAGILTTWVSGASMAVSPSSPYFWFAAGILAYWLPLTREALRRRTADSWIRSLPKTRLEGAADGRVSTSLT